MGAFKYVACGAKLHPFETLIAVAFIPFVLLVQLEELQQFVLWNGAMQLGLFVLLVQLPLLFSGNMIYVDLGWPWGLVILAVNGLCMGTGYSWRRYTVCICLLLHCSRLALGATLMFGKMSNFTYRFKEDLPRYRYAKHRWIVHDKMPPSRWWLKAQHDTFTQCWANAVLLMTPIALPCFNSNPEVSWWEYAALVLWIFSSIWENVADMQKMAFIEECKKQGKTATAEEKDKLKTAVLGWSDVADAGLWRLCRHPNYFGEWLAWLAFSLAAVPSLIHLELPLWQTIGFVVILVYVPRFFYDCLLHWTGAGPAEHFSNRSRPEYKLYQSNVRCFFPMEVPFVHHYRIAGWPDATEEKAAQG